MWGSGAFADEQEQHQSQEWNWEVSRMKKIRYERDTYQYVEGTYPPGYTYYVSSEKFYRDLEQYIDELVDFATEIREHEPTWQRAKK